MVEEVEEMEEMEEVDCFKMNAERVAPHTGSRGEREREREGREEERKRGREKEQERGRLVVPLVAPRDERETVYSCQPFVLANGLMLITGVPFWIKK